MKKLLVSFFCLFLFILASPYAQTAKEPKVITINSVRIMEVFKKENKAQYRTNPDKSETAGESSAAIKADAGQQSVADTLPVTESTESPVEQTGGTENTSDAQVPVTTEEAQKAIEGKKDDIIVFTGGVSVSVKEGSSVSTIESDKLVYNRSENTIEAEGNVRYSRKTGGSEGAEEFTGELLLFNIDEMEGIFLDGTIKQAPRKQGQNPFTIQSATVGRDSSGTTGFKDAALSTNPDPDEEPLWSIRASRIWLLPGNELAFANGYFSIGIVPILYLPFFYHPADEMVVHPVFGFRSREGYFLQTTTYLLGRKPLDTDSKKSGSFSNFMKSDRLKKQERIGLFFKNLDEDATDISPAYIKLIADTYSQLGGLVGIDGKIIPKNTPISQLDFSLFFGMSRTLFPLNRIGIDGITHTTYYTNGKRYYNKSFFLGMPLPFRYRAHINFGISQAPFQLSINVPFVSDPYFKKDFFDRSEDMNWFNYLLNKDKLAKGADIGMESSYSWKLNGSIRPSFKKISPWISSFNLDTASLTVNFSSKETNPPATGEEAYAPQRVFFYPSLFKPEGKISIAGTLLSNTLFNEKPAKKIPDVEGIDHPFITKDKTSSDTGKTENTDKKEYFDTFVPVFKPVYGKEFDHSITYSLTYSGDFSALQETTFASSQWNKPEDIRWQDYESRYYQLKGSAGLKGTLSYSQNLITLSSNLIISGNYQRHPWTRDVSKKPILELNNFKANVYTLKNENSVTVNPFVYNDLFKPISFSWSITEILAKNTFTGSYSNPKWETQGVKWNKDFITAHTGSAVFGVILAEKYTQKITFSMNLPPLLQAYSTSLNVSFPYGTLTASTKLFEKENVADKWAWEPFKADVTWTLPHDIRTAQTYIYNIQEKSNERLHITFGWKYISAFYTQSREIPQKLDPSLKTWVLDGTEKRFIPFALGFSFSNTSNPFTIYAWKNRIKIQLGLSSTLQFNLVRITDSYFTFAPKIIFNIHEFWDFSFGSSSRNDVIARYFQKALNLPIVIPGNTNVLTDLVESFYFWDTSKREASGFKLQSLDIGLTHYLKDWTLKFNCEIKPQLKNVGARKYYEFSPTITFAVEWKPIGDIKVEAKKKDGKFSVERGELQ
ncbi:LPS-assembly protein LptD [Treponema sp. OMZ 855]|uniref:LPS-assembly protein LptD n=1 Tax=Treponema sp. OMZ 855 TaxID=1643512 RepID=UPI0020A53C01|nr:LPS-assembly protein LptD [Treponema sp. OMZ 855]UTC51823.1 LPS-assembly protein LptD [Treponema sp. OMZ 855]